MSAPKSVVASQFIRHPDSSQPGKKTFLQIPFMFAVVKLRVAVFPIAESTLDTDGWTPGGLHAEFVAGGRSFCGGVFSCGECTEVRGQRAYSARGGRWLGLPFCRLNEWATLRVPRHGGGHRRSRLGEAHREN